VSGKQVPEIRVNPIQNALSQFDSMPLGLVFAIIGLIDSAYGLRYESGLFSVLIHGDPLWMVQFFEFILSSMFILNYGLNNLEGYKKIGLGLASPIIIILVFMFCIDQLFVGQESTASTTFNISSVIFSGLYWAAAYLSISVGLTLIYKVQRFGNFAQAEMMLLGAYIGFTMMWSPFFYTLIEGKKVLNIDVDTDEIITWDLFFWACVSGFVITGFFGVIIDKLVYSRFRKKNATPQVMMIASLGVAMILRGLLYLRYNASTYLFVPDKDWRMRTSKFEFSSEDSPFLSLGPLGEIRWPDWLNQTMRLRFGTRTSEQNKDDMDPTACTEAGKEEVSSSSWSDSENFVDANGNGQYDSSELFIDANGNGQYDLNEFLVDGNFNGLYDDGEAFTDNNGNGIWDDGICTIIESLSFREISDSDYFLQYTKAGLIFGVFASVILLLFLLNLSRLGKQMRAVADNPHLAASSGINVEGIHATTAFLAAGVSGFGGVLFGMYTRVNPEVGLSILLPAFAVIVLGTLGSVRGALIASLIVGLVRAISETALFGIGPALDRPSYSEFGEAMPYIFLIGVLMIMPKGLGNALENWKIERARDGKGSIFNLFNLFIFSFYLICWKITGDWFAAIALVAIIFFWILLLKSIKYNRFEGIINLPEIPYLGSQFKLFTDSQKFGILAVSILQVVLVSILDIQTSGSGTLYLIIDYIFFILTLIGLVLIYSSIISLMDNLNNIFSSSGEITYNQRNKLLVSGFSLILIFYGVDYLVNGSGIIYLVLDVLFLALQASGILLLFFTVYLSKNQLYLRFKNLDELITSQPEIRKWLLICASLFGVSVILFMDQITSGSGFLYYMVDLLYLILLVIGLSLTILVLFRAKSEIIHRINPFLVFSALLLLKYEPLIEPSSVRDTESTLYVTELAYLLLVLSFNDIYRIFFKAIEPLREIYEKGIREFGREFKIPVFALGFILLFFKSWILGPVLIVYSSNSLMSLISDFKNNQLEALSGKDQSGKEGLLGSFRDSTAFILMSNFTRKLFNTTVDFIRKHFPYGRESEKGSWLIFTLFLIVLIYVSWWLPSITSFTKSMQISRIIILVCIFSILSFSLNLHTGMTGMTNFGIIFFAGIGAITLGILTIDEEICNLTTGVCFETGGYGWSPLRGLVAAILVSGLAGWLLAYPTANLRMDYFAIVTISLGEIVRISMKAEPLLRAGTGTTAIGITQYALPFEEWWISSMDESVGRWLRLENQEGIIQAAPYSVLLAVIALASFIFIWMLLEKIISSPWGRILRAIREDEEVTMHHGHDVFRHKAMSLALGGAIAGFGGAIWAWLNMSILDDFINPINSTFLIWAAFVVGGRGNNRGMIIGAYIIVLTEFVFNLMVLARGDVDSQFHNSVSGVDEFFAWFVLDVIGLFNSDLSIIEPFGSVNPELLKINLVYLKLVMIGLVILVSLLFSSKGLVPEVPKRPTNPVDISTIKQKQERVV
jgi:ABC-type branched-subunit amino acid transport system permease subunit